ncbi:MAG TPA: hypothetical protein VES00_17240, partial [Burkholderiaceae bacterium]|nr:hypothetical protein [Burkholderiaceae bacterium]
MSDPQFPGVPPSDDPDATMMIPKPGGRRAAPAPAAGQAMTLDTAAVLSDVEDGGAPVGPNPLVANASVLLNTVPTIRRSMHHPDPAGLREYLLRAITEFEQRARAA